MNHSEEDKIVLTGGHAATTAIAVVEEIQKEHLPWKLFWIGAKYAIEGSKFTTLEFQVLPEHKVKFLPLFMGRIQRRFTIWTIPSLLKIPAGFFHSLYYLLKIKPKIVLSFGGFSSFPVVFVAKILGIPVLIHEQTAAAGRANRAEAYFADKIALSREESRMFFPKNKVVITGNPIAEKFFLLEVKKSLSKIPTIFVTGGSRGSKIINSSIYEILPDLLKNYNVIHQTGEIDEEKYKRVKKELPPNLSKNYEVFAKVDPSKIIHYYSQADLVISRAGANTVSEITAVKRPAILIPLAISYLDEQTKNAEILEKAGIGKIIKQSELSGKKLLEEIDEIFKNYNKYLLAINKVESPDKNAAKRIVDLLKECKK